MIPRRHVNAHPPPHVAQAAAGDCAQGLNLGEREPAWLRPPPVRAICHNSLDVTISNFTLDGAYSLVLTREGSEVIMARVRAGQDAGSVSLAGAALIPLLPEQAGPPERVGHGPVALVRAAPPGVPDRKSVAQG